MIRNYYFRFLADQRVPGKELEFFLREIVEPKALRYFSRFEFYKFSHSEQMPQFGGEFVVEDDRLQGVTLPKTERIYSHDPIEGKVVLRPRAGLVLSLNRGGKAVTSLGFLRFPTTVRNVWGKVLGQFEFGHDWVFHGHLHRPNPHVLELITLFDNWGYLDALYDADFDPDDPFNKP